MITSNRYDEVRTEALKRICEQSEEMLETHLWVDRPKCESPIEELMMLAFRALMWDDLGMWKWDQQVEVGKYRVDFTVSYVDPGQTFGTPSTIAVECDGHDFHEKTKQQAQRDKARDRALLGLGLNVVRFTGSEIWRDPFACAKEAMDLADDVYWKQFDQFMRDPEA